MGYKNPPGRRARYISESCDFASLALGGYSPKPFITRLDLYPGGFNYGSIVISIPPILLKNPDGVYPPTDGSVPLILRYRGWEISLSPICLKLTLRIGNESPFLSLRRISEPQISGILRLIATRTGIRVVPSINVQERSDPPKPGYITSAINRGVRPIWPDDIVRI